MKRVSGFTLLEIIVTLAILGTALSATSLIVSRGARDFDYLEARTFAHWIAQNTFNEIYLKSVLPEDDAEPVVVEMYGRQFTVYSRAVALEAPEPPEPPDVPDDDEAENALTGQSEAEESPQYEIAIDVVGDLDATPLATLVSRIALREEVR
ncbi:MAG: type II secretion system protein [Pseudomonadota bacterium]